MRNVAGITFEMSFASYSIESNSVFYSLLGFLIFGIVSDLLFSRGTVGSIINTGF